VKEKNEVGLDMDIQLSNIWIAAVVILGFQISWFSWRVTRETKMRSEGASTWFPIADIINLLSMMLIAIGVFILPILGLIGLNIVKRIFVLAILLVVGYPFAMAGHYELFTLREARKHPDFFPSQEKLAVIIISILAIIYLILSPIIR
jgi:hypothetical protein